MKNIFLEFEQTIFKLEINLNEKELKKVKQEVIHNCSNIKKVRNERREGWSLPSIYTMDEHYEMISVDVLQSEYHDAGYGDDDLPEISIASYNYYDYPDLVNRVNNLFGDHFGDHLGFNIEFIDKTKSKQYTEKTIVNKIKKLMEDETLSKNKKIIELEKLKQELDDIIEKEQSKRKPKDYYQDIFNCFEIQNISSYKKESLEEFIEFTECKLTIIKIENLDKIMQKFVLERIKNYKLTDNNKELIRNK